MKKIRNPLIFSLLMLCFRLYNLIQIPIICINYGEIR